MALANKVIYQNGAIREFEKPEVCEAIKFANANKWTIGLSPIEWNEREKRLKKEHEKNNKESAHDKKSMTLEEAKNLLEKEGFSFYKRISELCTVPDHFKRYENPKICKAMDIVNSAGYSLSMGSSLFDERKARLKKEYEESRKKEENPSLTFEEAKDFAKKDYIEHMERLISRKKERNEENPALKEAASQFNDSLLDEQTKKIAELTKKNVRLGKEIARLNKIIHKKNMKAVDLMEVLRKTESLLNDTREANIKNLDTCFKNEDIIDDLKKKLAEKTKLVKKYAKELSDSSLDLCKLEKKLKDKNAVLSDVAEELRLSKIREKNLAELGLKYVGENEELKKELADKVVDKIDAQALKSAESALAYKEKVITDLTNKLKSISKNRHNERVYKKKLVEKDEMIAELGEELAATKKELEEKTKLVEVVRNASKEYCDYGVAANEFIKKLANLYVIAANKGTISNEMFERCKNYQTYGFPATCNKETKKEINDIARGKENKKPRIPTPEISEEELMKIQEKVVASCDIAEEGGDYSATIVQCVNVIALSKEEAEIIERCTKNGTELHYSEKDGLTYTNMFGKEIPIRCLRGMFHVFTDEEIKNMKK